MEDESLLTIAMSAVTKPFNVLRNGNVAGTVYRLLSDEPVPVFDSPVEGSLVMVRLKPGALLVGFDDPGPMRQIITVDQMFGYMSRDVRLAPVAGITPEELYEPDTRAAVEASLPALGDHGSAHAAERARQARMQRIFMGAFLLIVLVGIAWVTLHAPDTPVAR